MSYLVLFCSCGSIAITSLGEERANLGAFRTFVRFALIWFCPFLLPLGDWEGLRFVIKALPGLFLLPFLCLYNFDPLKPHLYMIKLGFTGVYIIFLVLLKSIDCGTH